ncbi:hypothetical protein GCM10009836_16260 [Pseudonocardia ailaonensis]|uniref:DUF6286 domain-containing protein n=1 Tax=Pseudonocardia ailaonensis TaxID=367279 RepID=A0ABN2MUX6_9PSEU
MRVLLRTLAPLLGLVLAALGVLVVLEVVAAWLRPAATRGLVVPWQDWQARLGEIAWTDTTVRIVAICVAVLGLLLVLVALLARRHDVALTAPAPAMTVGTSPRVLARLVGRHVREADDVAAATVSASARRVVVRAEGWPDDESGIGGLRDSVRGRVDELLGELPLATTPRVTVTARGRREPQ